MLGSGKAELAAANPNADVHFHWPSSMNQGDSEKVRLEIGKPELLRLEDEAKEMASQQLSQTHAVLMTVSMKAYLTADPGMDSRIIGNDKGEFSTMTGYGLVEWIITPRTSGDHLIAWKLAALLKTQYGTFEQEVRSGQEHTTVNFTWTNYFRKLRDEKAVEGGYLLIGAVIGSLLKWGWDKVRKKTPEAGDAKEPQADLE